MGRGLDSPGSLSEYGQKRNTTCHLILGLLFKKNILGVGVGMTLNCWALLNILDLML